MPSWIGEKDAHSRIPGYVLEYVAFVDLHGVGDLSADRFESGGIERLDDFFSELHALGRVRLNDGAAVIVVGPVVLATQETQVPARCCRVGMARVGQTQPEIAVRPIRLGNTKTEVKQQQPGDGEGRIVGTA